MQPQKLLDQDRIFTSGDFYGTRSWGLQRVRTASARRDSEGGPGCLHVLRQGGNRQGPHRVA